MAEYKLGKVFALTFDEILIACKTTATLDLSNEGIVVVNDCTDDYGQALEGGTKSGTLSFEGDLDFDANGITTQSAFDLMELIGKIGAYSFGENSTGGERYITGDARLDAVSISTSTNERITFSGSLTLSGAPEVVTATT